MNDCIFLENPTLIDPVLSTLGSAVLLDGFKTGHSVLFVSYLLLTAY